MSPMYVPGLEPFVDFSVDVDAFSRRVVGWAMATYLQSELDKKALKMALYLRRPEDFRSPSTLSMASQYTSSSISKYITSGGWRASLHMGADRQLL